MFNPELEYAASTSDPRGLASVGRVNDDHLRGLWGERVSDGFARGWTRPHCSLTPLETSPQQG